jgi:hypothetical protein
MKPVAGKDRDPALPSPGGIGSLNFRTFFPPRGLQRPQLLSSGPGRIFTAGAFAPWIRDKDPSAARGLVSGIHNSPELRTKSFLMRLSPRSTGSIHPAPAGPQVPFWDFAVCQARDQNLFFHREIAERDASGTSSEGMAAQAAMKQ